MSPKLIHYKWGVLWWYTYIVKQLKITLITNIFTFLNAVIDFFRLNLGLSYKFFYNVTFNISIVNQSLIHACSYLSVLIMFYYELEEIMSFPGSSMVKNPLALSETWVECWVGKIPWRRKWQPTPLFLPGQFMGRGAWWATVHDIKKELDTTYLLKHHHQKKFWFHVLYVYIIFTVGKKQRQKCLSLWSLHF